MQLGIGSWASGKLKVQCAIDGWQSSRADQLQSRADDLIPEESDTVLLALKRLPPKEAYDRVFRLRRAFQVYKTICEVQIV